jgi:hypothetical protein
VAQIKNQAQGQGDDMSCKVSHAYFRTNTLAVVAALVVAHAAAAQDGRPPDSAAVAPALHVRWSGPSLTGADTLRLSATLARADSMVLGNRFSEAARLYWSVVVEQRAASEYPANALR